MLPVGAVDRDLVTFCEGQSLHGVGETVLGEIGWEDAFGGGYDVGSPNFAHPPEYTETDLHFWGGAIAGQQAAFSVGVKRLLE